jgi:hypothetical protein
MKTTEKTTVKRIYNSPEIVCIELDNEISLALESSPPAGPDEGYLKTQEYFNNDLFKTNIC